MKKFIAFISICACMMLLFAGCTDSTENNIGNESIETAKASPLAPTETSKRGDEPANEESVEHAVYFDIDNSNIEALRSLTPAFVLDGFYDVFIDCIPYIVEIQLQQSLYAPRGEILCRIEGISKHELKNIIENGFGITMYASDFADGGYDGLMDEDIYEVNKVTIMAFHGNVYLAIQDADFSSLDSFKLPAYYINQLGENAFRYAPEDSIIWFQRVAFDFLNNTFELTNQYILPIKNRQTIVDHYFSNLSNLDGYYYETSENEGQKPHKVRKTDELLISADYIDEGDGQALIETSIQYKELPLFDSSKFDYTRSLQFQDLYNETCKKILPALDGDVIEANLSQSDEFRFEAITDLPELLDKSAKDAVITELLLTEFGDPSRALDELVPIESILDIIGDAELYLDAEQLIIYKEEELAIRARTGQDEETNNGQPFLTYTIVEFNSSLYGNIAALAIFKEVPALNVLLQYEPEESIATLRTTNDTTLFKLSRYFSLESEDYDEIVALYQTYFASTYGDYEFDEMGDGNCFISAHEGSESTERLFYETRVFITNEDNTLFISAEVAEDWMNE